MEDEVMGILTLDKDFDWSSVSGPVYKKYRDNIFFIRMNGIWNHVGTEPAETGIKVCTYHRENRVPRFWSSKKREPWDVSEWLNVFKTRNETTSLIFDKKSCRPRSYSDSGDSRTGADLRGIVVHPSGGSGESF